MTLKIQINGHGNNQQPSWPQIRALTPAIGVASLQNKRGGKCIETLERALEAILGAKRESILIEASKENPKTLDDAYAGLAKAEQALQQLIQRDN